MVDILDEMLVDYADTVDPVPGPATPIMSCGACTGGIIYVRQDYPGGGHDMVPAFCKCPAGQQEDKDQHMAQAAGHAWAFLKEITANLRTVRHTLVTTSGLTAYDDPNEDEVWVLNHGDDITKVDQALAYAETIGRILDYLGRVKGGA